MLWLQEHFPASSIAEIMRNAALAAGGASKSLLAPTRSFADSRVQTPALRREEHRCRCPMERVGAAATRRAARQPAAGSARLRSNAGLLDAVRRRGGGREMRPVSSGVPRVTPSTLNPQARRGGTGIPVAR